MADLVASGYYAAAFRQAEELTCGANRCAVWRPDVCQDARYRAIEFSERDWPGQHVSSVTASARRACPCFAQQMLATDVGKVDRNTRWITARDHARGRPVKSAGRTDEPGKAADAGPDAGDAGRPRECGDGDKQEPGSGKHGRG
jgi:hypothetical protein